MIYKNRVAGFLLIPFGLLLLVLALCIPFLLEAPLLGFILMSAPMLFCAVVLLLQGFAAACTRIEILDGGLMLATPGWRGFPVPPVRRAFLSWNEVLAVRSRTEIYHVPIFPVFMIIPFPVNVFAVDTAKGRFLMGGQKRGLTEAVEEIANRSGSPVQFEGQVRAKFFHTLLHGAPEWPRVSGRTPLI